MIQLKENVYQMMKKVMDISNRMVVKCIINVLKIVKNAQMVQNASIVKKAILN